jgi:predicted nucleic acid-binding protein
MLLLDNSAWSRIVAGKLPADRARVLASWFERRQLATCLPFLLEAGYSARSAADRKAMMSDLDGLPRVETDPEVERLALHAQRELAEVGHHRLPPLDLTIAACAHRAEAGVLHYDRDYDLIAAHTSLLFESEWLAAPASL